MSIIHPNFSGISYHLPHDWPIDLPRDGSRPIAYAEIGVLHGANIISVALTFGQHPDSYLVAIDPWEDSEDYPEYKGMQDANFETYVKNLNACEVKDKIYTKRKPSRFAIPELRNDYFDAFYIDGNHEPEAVLEDGVLSFRKLKPGGWLIFDDYGWGGPDMTQRGIDAFISGYHKQTKQKFLFNGQMFVQKGTP